MKYALGIQLVNRLAVGLSEVGVVSPPQTMRQPLPTTPYIDCRRLRSMDQRFPNEHLKNDAYSSCVGWTGANMLKWLPWAAKANCVTSGPE